MLVDVVFLKQGDPKPLRYDGHLFAWRERAQDGVTLWRWEQSAVQLVQLALAEEFAPVDVFLCLKAQQLAELLDRRFTSQLVKAACAHSWAANVYVVVDPIWDPFSDLNEFGRDLRPHVDALRLWFEWVYEAGATDIIQVSVNRAEHVEIWNDPDTLVKLMSGADSSRSRHAVLAARGAWSGLRRKEDRVLDWFLEGFELHSDSASQLSLAGNLVTIIEDSAAGRQQQLLRKALLATSGQQLAALRRPFVASDHLKDLQHSGRIKLAYYQGLFELRYLFHLLGANHKSSTGHAVGVEKQVKLLAATLFQTAPAVTADYEPGLLVTSSFHPTTDPRGRDHCVAAAREVGRATIHRPAHIKYLVSPATNCQMLPELVKQLPPHLTAWLHTGHGQQRRGLREASGGYRSIGRWLQAFTGHGQRQGSLALAIFSACETVPIARRFARAGVSVAIGFTQQVPTDACHILTAEVIRAALRSKGDRAAILQAYHAGCANLTATDLSNLGPVAFCSRT